MAAVHYATIEIRFSAPEAKVNSSEELKLSNELGEIEYELGEWLRKRLAKTPFFYHTRTK